VNSDPGTHPPVIRGRKARRRIGKRLKVPSAQFGSQSLTSAVPRPLASVAVQLDQSMLRARKFASAQLMITWAGLYLPRLQL